MLVYGERRIPLSRERVWAALHDPAVLHASIPGFESAEPAANGEGGSRLRLAAEIGDHPAHFVVEARRLAEQSLESTRLAATASGGADGGLQGEFAWRLRDDAGATLLGYEATLTPEGRLADLGEVNAAGALRRLADDFLDRFTRQLTLGPVNQPVSPSGPDDAPTLAPPRPAKVGMLSSLPARPLGLPIVFWIGSALFALIFVMIFSAYL